MPKFKSPSLLIKQQHDFPTTFRRIKAGRDWGKLKTGYFRLREGDWNWGNTFKNQSNQI